MKRVVAYMAVLILLGACTKKETIQQIIQPPQATYIGSQACGSCHSEIYTEFMTSGHPWKLNKVSDILAAGGPVQYYPAPANQFWTQSNAGPPPGTDWSDFAYVIGGFGWKARFIKTDGYIYTVEGQGQYNLETNAWVSYHAGEEHPYDCGECHTTGYNPEGHQDDLPGIVGTWALPGIQCEECHGPGSLHAEDPYNVEMDIPVSTWEACGRCHSRGDPFVIDAKGGFIKHHEQYEELIASRMSFMACTDCHDPHASAHYNPEQAIRAKCETCHFEQAEAYRTSEVGSAMYNAGVECEDCHMPYAAKSAVKREDYQGDVRSHLFAINTDPEADMFNADSTVAVGYLTVDFACLYCHDNSSAHGEPPAHVMTREEAAAEAPLVHPVGTASGK